MATGLAVATEKFCVSTACIPARKPVAISGLVVMSRSLSPPEVSPVPSSVGASSNSQLLEVMVVTSAAAAAEVSVVVSVAVSVAVPEPSSAQATSTSAEAPRTAVTVRAREWKMVLIFQM